MSRQLPRLLSATYFLVQGLAILAWWALLWTAPERRELFLIGPLNEASLLGFWLADGATAALSIATGLWIIRSNSLAVAAGWVTAGLMTYAALLCAGLMTLRSTGWLALIPMVWAALLSWLAAWSNARG